MPRTRVTAPDPRNGSAPDPRNGWYLTAPDPRNGCLPDPVVEVSCSRCSKAREPRVACREILFIGLEERKARPRRCESNETAFDLQRFGQRPAIPKRKSTYYGRGHAWYLQVNVYTAPEKRGEVKARSIAPASAPCRPRRSCELLLV